MRYLLLLPLITGLGVVALDPAPAQAFGPDPFVAPEGGKLDKPKGQRIWSDRHRGACEGKSAMCGDPYAYRYIRRPWYPYYNSGYWVPAAEMRYRYRYQFAGPKYRYHPAWGHGPRPTEYEKVPVRKYHAPIRDKFARHQKAAK